MSTETETELAPVLDGLRAFVDSYVVPLEEKNRAVFEDPAQLYDRRGALSAPILDLRRQVQVASAEAGYYSLFCPVEIGGAGLGSSAQLATYEDLFHRYGPDRLLVESVIAHWAFGPSFLCTHFTPELSEKVLGDVIGGRVTMCFGMSEPDAGSDAWMMSTRAVRDGEEWVINGMKQWTSMSPHADYCYLFAVTDSEIHHLRKGGVSCFLVPMSTPGVSVDSVIKMLGDAGGNEGVLSFTDVRVPATSLVGREGDGFRLAMGGVSLGRIFNSGRAVGLSRWALEVAREHALSRRTFGKLIAEHQGVSFKLADSAMDIYAARCAAFDLAARLDHGEPAVRELAMAKAICAEAFLRVVDRCMQVCGAMGLTNEMRLYAAWHSARQMQLADGSAEILRVTISKRILSGEVDF